MGGTAATAALLAGTTLFEMHNNRKKAQRELKSIKTEQKLKQQKQQNLLEKDLASRRARISGSGLSDSNSALSTQARLASEATQDQNLMNFSYENALKSTKQRYKDKQYGVLKSAAQDVINNLSKIQ